jgi:DNA-binding transcriptional LysR family regulator
MELTHLRHYLAVADAGSFTGAAERVGIAQPALSQSIRRMEVGLGVRLFDRSRRGATLTAAGRAILDDVRQSVARIDAAQSYVQQLATGHAGVLRVAFVASAIYQVLPQTLRAYRTLAPDVRVALREMSNVEQAAALRRGEIDLGILYTPESIEGPMREQLLTRDHLVAVVPDDFPVGREGDVSLRDLARCGLVFFPQAQAPTMHAGILRAMRRLGEEGRVTQEATRTATLLSCVAAGCGVSLLPSATRRLVFSGVRYCEVRERSLLPTLELSAVWPARSRPTLADGFAALLAAPASARASRPSAQERPPCDARRL